MQNHVNTKMQNSFTLSFPSRLKQLRGTRTQAEIAKELGINQQTYARWELGDRQPKLDDLCMVSLHFGVTSDWLLGLPTADPKAHDAARADAAESKLSAVKKSLIALVKSL